MSIEDIISLAALLPSGINDSKAASKMLAEQQELQEALAAGDLDGALTEAADAAYYAAKHLQWAAAQVGLDVPGLLKVTEAKYSLRAQPGNPKDDAAERAACRLAADLHLA